MVEQSSNPVFNHAAHLRLADPKAWGRVCGPSAALVFRVWRRARCSWWDAPRAASTATAEQQPSFPTGEGVAAAAGSRFGDKLIGSAVVGLEVLRGAVDAREGLGLRDIDGWYHVLDDLQRPQGQIKVRYSINRVFLTRQFLRRTVNPLLCTAGTRKHLLLGLMQKLCPLGLVKAKITIVR